MLQCYQSINLQEHYEGYASWDSCVENIYFLDNKGFSIFETINNNLESPARDDGIDEYTHNSATAHYEQNSLGYV